MRWILVLALGLGVGLGPGCGAGPEAPAPAPPPGAAAPALSLRFVDRTLATGTAHLGRARGASWVDFDGDGALDLFAVSQERPHTLFWNNGDGTFTEGAAAAGVAGTPEGGWGAVYADVDNDGDFDLYVVRDGFRGLGPNALYRNDGGRRFTDVTRAAGVEDRGASLTASFGDYDRDGDLDLYVINGMKSKFGGALENTNRLYRNQGRDRSGVPRFVDVTAEAGVGDRGKGISGGFADLDGNGWPDLWMVNIDGGNVLYRNDGPGPGGEVRFTDVTARAGVADPLASWNTVIFDYDNDGDLDLYAGAWFSLDNLNFARSQDQLHRVQGECLYRNDGDWSFTEVGGPAGLTATRAVMSITHGDFDNDGWQDLYIGTGGPEWGRREPNVFYRNRGDGTFEEVGAALGVNLTEKTHGLVAGDFDADGLLDLYVPNGGMNEDWDAQVNVLFRNVSRPRNWIALVLTGTRSPRDPVGARVRLTWSGGIQYRELSGGSTFGSRDSFPLEFGLGEDTVVPEVEIRWPSGTVQVLRDLPVNRTVAVTEPSEGSGKMTGS